jgi:hypothetical protein
MKDGFRVLDGLRGVCSRARNNFSRTIFVLKDFLLWGEVVEFEFKGDNSGLRIRPYDMFYFQGWKRTLDDTKIPGKKYFYAPVQKVTVLGGWYFSLGYQWHKFKKMFRSWVSRWKNRLSIK